MHEQGIRRPPAALVAHALHLVALIEVEATGEELDPRFPDQFAAALEAVQDSLEQVAQDGFALMDYAAVPDAPGDLWPSEDPLDGSTF